MSEPLPPGAVTASYEEFRRLFPQRQAAWGELAEWERERWQRIIAAAEPAIRAAERATITACASDVQAIYRSPLERKRGDCGCEWHYKPFADLIGGES